MRANDVFQHAANRKDSNLEGLLSATRLIFRKLALKYPNQYDGDDTREDEHDRVPGDRILRRVRPECRLRGRTEFREQPFPLRIRVLHLEVVGPVTELVVHHLDDDRYVFGMLSRRLRAMC